MCALLQVGMRRKQCSLLSLLYLCDAACDDRQAALRYLYQTLNQVNIKTPGTCVMVHVMTDRGRCPLCFSQPFIRLKQSIAQIEAGSTCAMVRVMTDRRHCAAFMR
jgi:hypothetical protein